METPKPCKFVKLSTSQVHTLGDTLQSNIKPPRYDTFRLFIKCDDFTNETQQAQTFHVTEQVDNTWQTIFAKSGLIGDHFALSCLTHIRNDRTIDCKPWSAKYDSCMELTFMFFSHMCPFCFTTNSNPCKFVLYLWIISQIQNIEFFEFCHILTYMSSDDSHMALVMVILTSWRLQSTYWNKSIASKFWSFFDWEICHTEGEQKANESSWKKKRICFRKCLKNNLRSHGWNWGYNDIAYKTALLKLSCHAAVDLVDSSQCWFSTWLTTLFHEYTTWQPQAGVKVQFQTKSHNILVQKWWFFLSQSGYREILPK